MKPVKFKVEDSINEDKDFVIGLSCKEVYLLAELISKAEEILLSAEPYIQMRNIKAKREKK